MKRIDSIEQALQQAEKLQFVMVTELSRVVIGKMPIDINWDELIEARFFDHDTEIRIFRENGELSPQCDFTGRYAVHRKAV